MAYTKNYEKQTWTDLPEQTTPISAERLTHMEDGIDVNDTRIKDISEELDVMGETTASKMDSTNPTGTGALSLNRATYTTVGQASSATGTLCEATGHSSHAEGYCAKATGHSSHAEGYYTKAAGVYAHSEGYQCVVNGSYSHAEGNMTVANGVFCHTEGYGTESHASGMGQHIQGKYNAIDDQGMYAHIVGGGISSSSRSNIHTLDWSGNAKFSGNVTDGNGDSIASLKALISAISGGGITIAIVETLPTENISSTTIYFVPAQAATAEDYYEEYMYVNNAWELLGNTSVDLSDYYTKEEVAESFVAKMAGKGLSSNDYTTGEKDKLDGISESATRVESSSQNGKIIIDGTEVDVYVHPTGEGSEHIPSGGNAGQILAKAEPGYVWKNEQDIPSKTSDLTNDSSFVADSSYVHTDNNFNDTYKGNVDSNTSARHTHPNETVINNTTASFLIAEKNKLSGIEDQANKTTVDTTFNQASSNPASSSAIALWVTAQIANGSLKKEIVTSLPTTNISTTTIYMILKQTASTDDVYNEYLNLDGTTSGWELIGTSDTDMTNYYTKTEVNTLFAPKSTTQTKIKTVTNKTIAVADVVTNTDDYSATYGYKADIPITGMTATMQADITTAPGADITAMGIHCNSMAGSLRVYFTAVPATSIAITNITYWEVG